MSRLTPEQKLARLHQKKDQLMSELRSAAGKVGAKSRKNDTRRKILLGTILLELSATTPKILEWVEGRIRKLPEKDAAPFSGWNFAEAAAAAATRARAKAAAEKAAPSPAPAQGAFGGDGATVPARGAPSAPPIGKTNTKV